MSAKDTHEPTLSPEDDPPKEAPSRKGMGGKKGRSGPPLGSQNAARHYLRAGKLPSHLQYIEQRINGFRRHLEELVVGAKGEVSMTDAATINSACKWERHGILAQHWLRKEEGTLSASDRLKFSSEIAKASDNRDRNLRLLELDKQLDVWQQFDSQPPKITDVEG